MAKKDQILGQFIWFRCDNAGIPMGEFVELLDPDNYKPGSNQVLIKGSYLNIAVMIFELSAS